MINYLNLSNGIKYIDKFNNTKVIRIQSSLLENKQFDKVIADLDYSFLYDLAIGEDILLIDSSSKKDKSRVIYQGVPWIEYVLNRYWLNKVITPYVRQHDVDKYFNEQYNNLKKCTKSKLKYFRKILNSNIEYIKINVLCFGFEKDIKPEEMKEYIYENKDK